MNLASQYLKDHNETIADYETICGELADAIASDGDDILYVEPHGDFPLIPLTLIGGNEIWKYHMVLLRDGLVHDAWCEGAALPPCEWLIKMFGAATDVEVSLNGETVFTGPCDEFKFQVRLPDLETGQRER